MAKIILVFHSRKLRMPLLEVSCPIYSFRPMRRCVIASCQDILTGSLHLGPLETGFFNLALDIIPRLALKMC